MKAVALYILVILPLLLSAQNKVYSPQNLPPDVHFSWQNSCTGDTTCFTNQTQLGNTYTWTVVGGIPHPHTIYMSNDTNICFAFPGPGSYSVSLHAYNNHDVILTKVITIDTLTKANFDFVRCANIFANNSLCSTSFHWNFGDGTTSSLLNPIHQYADTGHYNVTLIAYNGQKSDTITKNIFVDAISYVNPAFTYTVSFDTVFVHANFGSGMANYYWNFNDPLNPLSNNATGRDTMHIYKDSTAAYDISLTVVNGCGPRFFDDSIRIVSLKLPSALSFTSNLAIIPSPIQNGEMNAFYNSFVSGEFLVGIYDPLGKVVLEEYFTFLPGINGFTMNISSVPAGVYILTILSENTFTRRKFVVSATQ